MNNRRAHVHVIVFLSWALLAHKVFYGCYRSTVQSNHNFEHKQTKHDYRWHRYAKDDSHGEATIDIFSLVSSYISSMCIDLISFYGSFKGFYYLLVFRCISLAISFSWAIWYVSRIYHDVKNFLSNRIIFHSTSDSNSIIMEYWTSMKK